MRRHVFFMTDNGFGFFFQWQPAEDCKRMRLLLSTIAVSIKRVDTLQLCKLGHSRHARASMMASRHAHVYIHHSIGILISNV